MPSYKYRFTCSIVYDLHFAAYLSANISWLISTLRLLLKYRIHLYRITPQRAACRYKWGWPFSWKWPYGAIPACRYKPRYAFPRNFCPFSNTSFIIQIWVILTQFHFKSIVSKLKFIWALLLIQKFYFNHLNPLNFFDFYINICLNEDNSSPSLIPACRYTPGYTGPWSPSLYIGMPLFAG